MVWFLLVMAGFVPGLVPAAQVLFLCVCKEKVPKKKAHPEPATFPRQTHAFAYPQYALNSLAGTPPASLDSRAYWLKPVVLSRSGLREV